MAAKAPYFDITIGDYSVERLGIKHLISKVTFEEEFGKFDTCTVELKSGPSLDQAYQLVKHGSVMQLSMGYFNDDIKPMFLGFLQKTKPNFSKRTISLTFAQYLKAMDVSEKDRVLTGKTLQSVVRSVLSDYAAVIMGNIENKDIIVSNTISQSKRTDFKLLQDIASAFAMKWYLEPTDIEGKWAMSLKRLDAKAAPVGKPFYAWPSKEGQDLSENIHLEDFQPESNILGGASSNVSIESNNPNQPIQVNSKKYPTDKYVTQSRGSEIVYTVFGQVRRVHFYENLSDEEAAQIIADQMFQDDELTFVTSKNTKLSEGDCLVRAGQRRKVHPRGIPIFEDVFDGVYTITKTKHVIDTDKGYDAWVDMGRESLSLPPPPMLPPPGSGGGAGGYGSPVVVYVYQSGAFEAYYITFVEGGYKLGNRIPTDEFLANDHYMGRMRGAGFGGVDLPFTMYTPGQPGGPWGLYTEGESGVPVSENMDSYGGGYGPRLAYALLPGEGLLEGRDRIEVHIDWGDCEPPELAVPLDIPPGGLTDENISGMAQESTTVKGFNLGDGLLKELVKIGQQAEQEEAARQQALQEGNVEEWQSYLD